MAAPPTSHEITIRIRAEYIKYLNPALDDVGRKLIADDLQKMATIYERNEPNMIFVFIVADNDLINASQSLITGGLRIKPGVLTPATPTHIREDLQSKIVADAIKRAIKAGHEIKCANCGTPVPFATHVSMDIAAARAIGTFLFASVVCSNSLCEDILDNKFNSAFGNVAEYNDVPMSIPVSASSTIPSAFAQLPPPLPPSSSSPEKKSPAKQPPPTKAELEAILVGALKAIEAKSCEENARYVEEMSQMDAYEANLRRIIAAGETAFDSPWACTHCTFENPGRTTVCQICNRSI